MGYEPFSLDNGDNAENTSGDFGTASVAPFLKPDDGGGSDGGTSGGNSGDVDSNGDRFDESIHVDRDKRNADGSFRKRRGRKPNSAPSGNRARSSNKASIEALTRALAIVHLGIASATKTPEIALEDEEAQTLASAVNNVLIEFDIRPDPKSEAIFGLVVAAGSIYGPRVYLVRERKKQERKDNA